MTYILCRFWKEGVALVGKECGRNKEGVVSSKGVCTSRTLYLLVEFRSEVIGRVEIGDRFVLKTEDPESLPLPSEDLLELQFRLQRIASMAGAAGVDRLGLHYDDTIYVQPASQFCVEQWLDSCVSANNGYA